MRELREYVAIALVEAMGIESCAARGDAEDEETVLPCPLFDVLAEAQADLAIAIAVFHDESADEGVRRGLQMMLDGDLDPADDFGSDAGDEGGLIVGAGRERINPRLDVGRGAPISELLGEQGGLICIAGLNRADKQLRGMRSGGFDHDNMFSRV